MKTQVLNNKIFTLNGTSGRYWHLLTLTRGLKEYMCFIDILGKDEYRVPVIYIEEVTGGHLEKILEDDLYTELKHKILETYPLWKTETPVEIKDQKIVTTCIDFDVMKIRQFIIKKYLARR